MIVNIWYCTGHQERYRFKTKEDAARFQRKLSTEVQDSWPNDDVIHIVSEDAFNFREGSCQWNECTMHSAEIDMKPIEMPTYGYLDLAIAWGGMPDDLQAAFLKTHNEVLGLRETVDNLICSRRELHERNKELLAELADPSN